MLQRGLVYEDPLEDCCEHRVNLFHFYTDIYIHPQVLSAETHTHSLIRIIWKHAIYILHCKEPIPIIGSKYIFPEKELRGHSPSFHIHLSVSDL